MKSLSRIIALICLLFLFCKSHGQVYSTTQNITGVINTYISVTAISPCSLSVASTAGFAAGNKVLLIQMQGADVDLSNNASFGSINAINDVGNYEFATISSITGLDIIFTKTLTRTYDPASGAVQLITVPEYNGGAVVTGALTAQNWNGITGGVLAFDATTLILNANIDVTGKGFRRGIDYGGADGGGGDASYRSPDNGTYGSSTTNVYITCTEVLSSSNPSAWLSVCSGSWRNAGNSGCGCTVIVPGCINPVQTDPLTYASGTQLTCLGYSLSASSKVNAEKGEGIVPVQPWYRRGRGKIANGGGGGNQHNGGGGGGGNYGAGGIGGRGLQSTGGADLAQGIGGVALSAYYASNKVFMGGGGGAGQGNDNKAIEGSNGGGIVIIKATTLQNPSGRKIMANGEINNYASATTGGFDGAGGGGGAGAVLLDIATYGNLITIEAVGGKGADNLFNVTGGDCYAPGGGGGGGVIGFSQAATPAGVTAVVAGGAAGVQSNPSSCVATYTISYGAEAGKPGAVINSLNLPTGIVACTLPVDLLYFKASVLNSSVVLLWKTATETNNDRFEILRSSDLLSWESIGIVKGSGNSLSVKSYSFLDVEPPLGTIYYKIKQVDLDGTVHETRIEAVSRGIGGEGLVQVFPNPLLQGNPLNLFYYSLVSNDLIITLTDVLGKTVFEQQQHVEAGTNQLLLELEKIARGTYFLNVNSDNLNNKIKIVVM